MKAGERFNVTREDSSVIMWTKSKNILDINKSCNKKIDDYYWTDIFWQ